VYSKAEVQEVTQANANILINGDFQVWQRGETFSSGDEYTADRWRVSSNSTGQRSSLVPVGIDSVFSLAVTGVAAAPAIYTSVELPLVGTTAKSGVFKANTDFTISYWVKATSGNFGGVIRFADQVTTVGGTRVPVFTIPSVAATGSWQKIEHTFNIGSAIPDAANRCLEIVINNDVSASTFSITQAKLEEGSVATPFEVEPYGDVLLKCRRYYWQGYAQDSDAFKYGISGSSNAVALSVVSLPTTLRAAPTIAFLSGTPVNCTPSDFSFGFDGFTHRGSINSTGYYRVQTALYEADAEL
jgi:hypothetical protein